MARTGIRPKCSTMAQQRENAQLELIIEEFGRAMRNAHRPYIARGPREYCCHEGVQFTPSMEKAWRDYTEFCMKYPNE